MNESNAIIEKTNALGANNYCPLPVVVTRGEGPWVWDAEGKKYLDMLSAYSAVSHGHRHPKLLEAMKAQMERITLISRAFHCDQLVPFYERLVRLTGLPKVLPMNTGAEAVETALKAARRWGHRVKGIPDGQAEIIVCSNNFHGRTISVISFSSEEEYKAGFGPLTPGFVTVPFGDIAALESAITERTAAFIVEPIQGEGGIIVPPAGYLKQAEALCRKNRVLFVADEIQTGLARTGKMFCCEHDGVQPDIFIIGKALGGGMYPVSAIVGTEEVMGVFEPGSHGSTFGGNPLAAAVATAAIDVIEQEGLAQRAQQLGDKVMAALKKENLSAVKEIRGKGLLIGVELKPEVGGARAVCERLQERGLLCKETHTHVLRLAPPLVIEESTLDWALEQIITVVREAY